MFSIFNERISVEDKWKILKKNLQKNYKDKVEVPKRIIMKPKQISEFIMSEIPIELFTAFYVSKLLQNFWKSIQSNGKIMQNTIIDTLLFLLKHNAKLLNNLIKSRI